MTESSTPETPARFKIEDAGFLPTAGVYWIIGVLDGEGVDAGVAYEVVGAAELRIVIRSVTLVNYQDVSKYRSGKLMLSIEPPDFDVESLRGHTIVPVEPPHGDPAFHLDEG